MPYITASIIMQLLAVVIPKLEEWQKEGATGTARITQITRYVTVVLAVLQSTGLIVLIESGQLFGGQIPTTGLIPNDSLPVRALMILTLTAGTAFIMWLGELITQRGIGNGMSLIIFARDHRSPARSVLGHLPAEPGALRDLPAGRADTHRRVWSTSNRASAASRCSTPNARSAGASTAASRPTSR